MTTLTRRLFCALLFANALASPNVVLAQANEEGPIAIVVHPDSPLADLSAEELRRLFLGSTTSLDDGERVELAGLTDTRARFYRAALGMSEARFKRHWISRVFAGQPGTPPVEFRDADDLLNFVSSHPGAVAFIDAAAVSGDAKTVRIDGRAPTDRDYVVR